ncbi:MAG: D-2-hydroxyacid dehydrogenase [Anaerolineae bacterium]|nr:D-2-hydroxyacid dehydrogenase [Anaerolineae bacterium]
MMKLYAELNLNETEASHLRDLVAPDDLWLAQAGRITEADHAAFQAAEVAFGNVAPAWVADAPGLRWLQLAAVGIDAYRGLDWDVLGSRLVCANLRGVFSEPVAETCLAGILALYRGLDRLIPWQADHNWQKLALRPTLRLLHGSRVVLVGAGTIAQRLYDMLAPFGCAITVFGQRSGHIHTLAELDAALADADIVCASLPETHKTAGLFDAARLARLKPGAVFANVGRGSVLDEAALVEALRSGALGGAVLDVTQQEPLPPDHPLWTAPNTILTQHTGGGSADENSRIIHFFTANLARYRGGEALLNAVDWRKGY